MVQTNIFIFSEAWEKGYGFDQTVNMDGLDHHGSHRPDLRSGFLSRKFRELIAWEKRRSIQKFWNPRQGFVMPALTTNSKHGEENN